MLCGLQTQDELNPRLGFKQGIPDPSSPLHYDVEEKF